MPKSQLIEWKSTIDCVYKNTTLHILYEKMRKIVHIIISGRVPNVELEIGGCSIVIFNRDGLVEVLNHIGSLICHAFLRDTLHVSSNYTRLSHLLVSHDDYFRGLRIIIDSVFPSSTYGRPFLTFVSAVFATHINLLKL